MNRILTTGCYVILLGLIFTSCKENDINSDLCGTSECLNGGICIDGSCNCPIEFSGPFCELKQSIQQRLDWGDETPLDLIQSGVRLKDLYGKNYAGGLIFYIHTNEEINPEFMNSGLVATPETRTEEWIWGCNNINSMVPNVDSEELLLGVRIGDGKSNTEKIVASDCPDLAESAAAKCLEYEINGYTDWYLPSKEELKTLCTNLAHFGLGFNEVKYWSSSEVSDSRSWIQSASACDSNSGHKNGTSRIHPIRSF